MNTPQHIFMDGKARAMDELGREFPVPPPGRAVGFYSTLIFCALGSLDY